MDKKLEYLVKTFSRTNKKDYENYILTGIWHMLNRWNICFNRFIFSTNKFGCRM